MEVQHEKATNHRRHSYGPASRDRFRPRRGGCRAGVWTRLVWSWSVLRHVSVRTLRSLRTLRRSEPRTGETRYQSQRCRGLHQWLLRWNGRAIEDDVDEVGTLRYLDSSS